MNRDFRECLRNKKLMPFPRAKRLVRKEVCAAEEDLVEAQDRFGHSKYKYATITAYYAIFHAARALVYSRGYRERSHHCLGVALDVFFVERSLMEDRFIKLFRDTMSLREDADYGASFSEEGAAISITNAKEFIQVMRDLLSSD